MNKRIYVSPAIETHESSEILEMIGPVQGYGPAAEGSWRLTDPRPDSALGWRFR